HLTPEKSIDSWTLALRSRRIFPMRINAPVHCGQGEYIPERVTIRLSIVAERMVSSQAANWFSAWLADDPFTGSPVFQVRSLTILEPADSGRIMPPPTPGNLCQPVVPASVAGSTFWKM